MALLRLFLLGLLALLAILPNLISSMVWGPINIAFAALVVGVMLFLAIKKQRVAKWAIGPLAAILTLPPYPYWVFMDNGGTYHLVFNRDGIKDSVGFFAVLFVGYAVVFFLIYFIARRARAVPSSVT